MGKPLGQLDLSSDDRPQGSQDLLVQEKEARAYLRTISDLRDDGTCAKYWDFLDSVAETIRTTQQVTPRQKEAILNIQRAQLDRASGRRWNRRY